MTDPETKIPENVRKPDRGCVNCLGRGIVSWVTGPAKTDRKAGPCPCVARVPLDRGKKVATPYQRKPKPQIHNPRLWPLVFDTRKPWEKPWTERTHSERRQAKRHEQALKGA